MRTGHSVASATNLAQYEPALAQSRLDDIHFQVLKRVRMPDEVDFATYIQPPVEGKRNGLYVLLPENVVFLVVSPNPNPRYQNKLIKTFAVVSMEDWRAKEGERWHYVGAPDPALPIFTEMARQHMAARRDWKELQ